MAVRNTYFQDEVVHKKIDKKQLLRVLTYVLPYKRIFIGVMLLMLVSGVISLISPMLLRYMINTVIYDENYRRLGMVLGGLIMLAAMEIGLTFIHTRLMGKMGYGIIATLRKDIFYKLQQLSFDYFDNRPDGKIVVRVTDYINELANFFSNFVMMFFNYIIKIVIVTGFMLSISVPLTGVVYAAILPMMACVFLLRHSVHRLFGDHRAKVSNRTAFLVECIMGEKIVKNFNRMEMNETIYEEIHNKSVKAWWRIVLRNELNTPVVESFWNIGLLALYGSAFFTMSRNPGTMDIGTVVAFTSYMGFFSGPLTQIAMIIQNLAQVSSNLEQVFDTIDHPVLIDEKKDAIDLENVKGQVDFNQVTFSYDIGNPILENFNLHVKPGETIALVGPTGAGKTTIIQMLTRFYDVDSGSVCIDGQNVKNLNLHSLRKAVGILMQDPYIFKGSVMENIRYGRLDATDEECIAAAETIFADRVVKKWKDGYGHPLEERGEGLSSGEKQLLSFARIVLKNPSILILDEATSSVDTDTENLIRQALDRLIEGKTAFMVAHRLSTIRNADRILYICNKGIAETGSHEELMEQKGLYYALNVN